GDNLDDSLKRVFHGRIKDLTPKGLRLIEGKVNLRGGGRGLRNEKRPELVASSSVEGHLVERRAAKNIVRKMDREEVADSGREEPVDFSANIIIRWCGLE